MAASREMAATPICRCRVLYLGSAVPHVTKDGLQGIQEPLRELYPEAGALGAKGIDSWLSVWSNGLLLENVDENQRRVTRFFPIESLHYCAAVRYVLVPAASGVSSAAAGAAPPTSASAGVVVDKMARFLPLDSPFARQPNIHHPPLFACIMRRTTGIKVLECHVFICKRETAANALVRCCFHAYADSTYAHHLENGGGGGPAGGAGGQASAGRGGQPGSGAAPANGQDQVDGDATLNSIEKVRGWRMQQQQGGPLLNGSTAPTTAAAANGSATNGAGSTTSSHGMGSASVSMLILDNGSADEESVSLINGDANHKVWAPAPLPLPASSSTPSHAAPPPPAPQRHPHSGGVGVYGPDYSTMRSTGGSMAGGPRGSRPRQISHGGAAPPPPPPPLSISAGSVSAGLKKKLRGIGGGSKRDADADSTASVTTVRRPSSVFNFPINGNGMRGHHPAGIPALGALHPLPGHPGLVGYPVFNGRPRPGGPGAPPMGHHGPPPAYLVPVPMALPKSSKKSSKSAFKFGTFSARGKKSSKSSSVLGSVLGGPINPSMAPPPGVVFLPPHHPMGHHPMGHPGAPPMVAAPAPMALGVPVPLMAPPLSMRRSSSRTTLMSAEEPIYMPSGVRPLSPIASYAPERFPHEAYLQYAALPPSGEHMHQLMTLQRHHHHHHQQQQQQQQQHNKKTSKNKKNKKNDGGDAMHAPPGGTDDDGDEELLSHSGAGIYRKGHINERAFSYSIRQEHRSRSYSSLANYPAGGSQAAGANIGTTDLRERDKKERELIQMVHDLDLSGDDLERSEVPVQMYPHHHRQPR